MGSEESRHPRLLKLAKPPSACTHSIADILNFLPRNCFLLFNGYLSSSHTHYWCLTCDESSLKGALGNLFYGYLEPPAPPPSPTHKHTHTFLVLPPTSTMWCSCRSKLLNGAPAPEKKDRKIPYSAHFDHCSSMCKCVSGAGSHALWKPARHRFSVVGSSGQTCLSLKPLPSVSSIAAPPLSETPDFHGNRNRSIIAAVHSAESSLLHHNSCHIFQLWAVLAYHSIQFYFAIYLLLQKSCRFVALSSSLLCIASLRIAALAFYYDHPPILASYL